MKDGFVRICAATPELKVADCRHNRIHIEQLLEDASGRNAAAVVFPELCMTGYTCGDLFETQTLLCQAEEELARLLQRNHPPRKILTACYEPMTGSHVGPGALALFFYGKASFRPAQK